ncbi:DUF6443 domain-containing protein, partial [Mucilaginibacter sp.]|uniref:DUF6443 domain-containing protein n=1 Tax=Mucilaginibacter sp. TaxID=1882438 RepID=UPI00326345FD
MANKTYSANRLPQAVLLALLCLFYIPLKAQTNGPLTLSSANTTGDNFSNRKVTLSPGFTSSAPFKAKIVAIDCIPLTTAPSTNQNYIISNTPRISGIKNEGQLAGRGTCELQQAIQYVDGLGRPIQSVAVMASPFAYDMVQPTGYDQYGREVKKYLPYVPTNGTMGAFRSDALTGAQSAFYQNQSDKTGIVQIPTATQVAYAETLPENSPLGRTLQQGSPGLNNQINGGHTVTMDYRVNLSTDNIKLWQVGASGGASTAGNYPAGTLTKTIVTDENQNNNAVIQFKDKNDRVISRWVQKSSSAYVITDYIYDDLGHLRYVVPPLPGNDATTGNTAVAVPSSFAETDNVFKNFFYAYHYDGLDRLTEKKVPGQGWQYIVYNTMDQPILTQDANQKGKNIWMVTKYDAQGRVVQTGKYYRATATRDSLQTVADGINTNLYESFSNATTNYGYTHVSFPDISSGTNNKVLTAHYLDNYDVISNASVNPGATVFTAPNAAIDSLDKAPRSLPIATLTNVLGTSTYLFSVMHYDKDGRPVKVISQHYQGGAAAYNKYDTEESMYSFLSLALQSTRKHYLAAGIKVTINNWTGYDHANRALLTRQQYITPANTGAITTLSKLEYNEVGQVKVKHVGSTNSAAVPDNSTFLQHTDLRYNANGSLARINNPNSLTDETFPATFDVFAEQLDYDVNNNGYAITPNYNGNISSMSWQSMANPTITPAVAQEKKGFVYTYDALNRLTIAASKAASTGDNQYNENLTYDDLGNILTLARKNGVSTILNNMKYNYMDGTIGRSNILRGITDNGSVTENQATIYTYDTNGNLTYDTKKGVAPLAYNELNLPQTVTITGSPAKSISYVYDAAGTKLQKITTIAGSIAENRTYNTGIEYVADTLSFIHTSEGRVLPAITGPYVFEYQIADHLGNVRAMFGDKNNNGVLATDEVWQVTDYSAFGRQITNAGYLVSGPENQYKYNGKEYQTDLSEYDYGARFYDPVIGRFTTVDPSARSYVSLSPYNYVNNNPVGS